ncbi:transporter [Ganoderma sinense ZZ0214-1]|uniref:Transporter n=1 Tax=Ganoderma sinense ZZ0214-1 TaxID=1077348 RepID=A0A2G8RXP6_9APHY|nr:transporter [Ganoderma sinense ZZ0214-1]
MASKQLGKLRQFVGEVIMSRDKTIQSDEFRELEHDVELRRQGLWRLDVASDDYRHYLLKKKPSEVTGTEDKMLAVDALGAVMIKHGEEFGEDSAYGQSLVNFGRAHCNIATFQESFAATFEETYIASVKQSEDEIKEYQMQRKKLESRRLTHDAAVTKLDKLKNAKKVQEKDREDAEDELDAAKARYEETLEDVRTRMFSIQENEVIQLRELTNFLDLEITFVQSCLDELQKVKAEWVDEDTMKNLGAPKARPPPRPVSASRTGSIRSTKATKKQVEEPVESSEDEEPTISRRKSVSRKKSDASSKPPSRAPSRASRKRADSTATTPSDKEEKEKEKTKPEKSSNRLSVAGGWGAMSSIIGRGKKDKEKDKDKNKEKFAELDSDESETDEFGVVKGHKHRSSIPGLPSASPKLPARLLKSFSNDKEKDSAKDKDKENRKRVVALHDFAAGSTDELSFKAGDQIDVVSEVLDGWWMGELDGKRGLFPTTYTEVINSSHSSLPPPLPYRPASSVTRARGLSNGAKNSTSSYSSLEDTEHPFGDHNSRKGKPGKAYEGSIQSSNFSDDDDSSSLMHVQRVDDTLSSKYITGLPAPAPAPASPSIPPPIPTRRDTTSGSAPKKAPPPPPPRRSTLSSSAASTPPRIPSRPATLRTQSSASSSYSTLAVTGTTGPDGLTYSPFDSPMEEKTRFDCREFKQNPFKPQGFCNNCFKLHY